MKTAVMPGSFDPFTLGHADILQRSCKLFDFVYVGILINKSKHELFTPEERMFLVKKVICDMNLKNADAECFDGLLIDFVKAKGASATIRGIRSIDDFTSELTMADLNAQLYKEAETVCLFSAPQFACVSSSAVKEIGSFGGDISGLVPRAIYDEVKERINSHA